MRTDKPEVLKQVEQQTKKSYGNREGGKGRINLPPIFDYMGVCWSCGKTKHVNAFGFCEKCWITYSHLREPRLK